MKRKSLFFALLLCSTFSYGQSGASYVTIHDTRNEVNSPADFSQQLRLDFKSAFNDTPIGQFSTTLTIAPWIDVSGNGTTQFNISRQGLFFRGSNPSYTGWEAWKKIAMFDESGDLYIGDESGIGEFGKRLYFGSGTCNLDDVYIARYNVVSDETELRITVGDDERDKFVVGNKHWDKNEYNKYFVVTMDGKVGINSPNPTYELEVNGKIKTQEILVTDTGWADFVFKKDYKLRSLQEVESHIEQHSSLPEMPTESEVNANGMDLAKMNVKLLQKVEELTLYIIQQEKRITELEKQRK